MTVAGIELQSIRKALIQWMVYMNRIRVTDHNQMQYINAIINKLAFIHTYCMSTSYSVMQ